MFPGVLLFGARPDLGQCRHARIVGAQHRDDLRAYVSSVEDVALQDGKLQTKSGAELKPGNEFISPVGATVPPRTSRDRLIRRGL